MTPEEPRRPLSPLTDEEVAVLPLRVRDALEAHGHVASCSTCRDTLSLVERAAADLVRLTAERDDARAGLFHRITGWDPDGQQETKCQDELQVLRDEVTAQRAEVARLESERAEEWRQRRAAQGDLDVSKAVVDTLRAEGEALRQRLEADKAAMLMCEQGRGDLAEMLAEKGLEKLQAERLLGKARS